MKKSTCLYKKFLKWKWQFEQKVVWTIINGWNKIEWQLERNEMTVRK